MLYPVCDVPYRQHQAPTILAAMTGRTYAESKTAVKLHLSLKIKSISPSNFMTVLERCGFHVVRQYAEFDEQIWLAVDSVSQVMPEVPLVLERTAERSLSAEQAQKNARRTRVPQGVLRNAGSRSSTGRVQYTERKIAIWNSSVRYQADRSPSTDDTRVICNQRVSLLPSQALGLAYLTAQAGRLGRYHLLLGSERREIPGYVKV
jgi:hypothetical protein